MFDKLFLHNGEAGNMNALPRVPFDRFREEISVAVKNGARLCALFAIPAKNHELDICAILAHDTDGKLSLCLSKLPSEYPAITLICPQAHMFEREIAENWRVLPKGHPWLKPVRFNPPFQPAVTDFFKVEGDDIHEVAVGPVHAGVIEPGHFRFQCHGELVLNLEIALGFQHRGVEHAINGGPNARTIHYMETLAGDTTIGHALAYSQAIVGLSGMLVSPRAQAIRGIALELERLANHTGDLGALAGDVGYLPTASYCGRIRGDFLNLQAMICGNRFGRGIVRPGGVQYDIEPDRAKNMTLGLEKAMAELEDAAQLLWDSPSVLSRFDDTGRISADICRELGLVGLPVRACGIEQDVRSNFPIGIYRYFHLPVSTWHRGDVFARAFVRWMEIKKSAEFVLEQLSMLTAGPLLEKQANLKPNHIVVSLVEGWRGEICHVAVSGDDGRLAFYKVVDPSFHNWTGLAMALRNGEISDFPLSNKSFNLSYCGHDL